MEDIEHVFAGAMNLLLVVQPCDKFPEGVYRAYAMRDGKPKSAYVMNPDGGAGKGNVVKWAEIKKEHKYVKYDDIGYWLPWKRLLGVPKKRSREQLLHDWWHAVAEARQHGRAAPTLSSVIDTYVESKRPANDEGAAAQSSFMTKPEESVLLPPDFHDTETRKNVAGRNPLDVSVVLERMHSLDRSVRVTKAQYTVLRNELAERFTSPPTLAELQNMREQYLEHRGRRPFDGTGAYVRWVRRTRRHTNTRRMPMVRRVRVLPVTADLANSLGVTLEQLQVMRDAFLPLLILNKPR
ncbi:hypothetical protein W97_04305 [Coniosporium apollinis CBS 100218]|uniref:Uncharacterized protein n=1 Tax=Coniosporium apollinis (strain CBS 100218) TaxID=1168221 RepID=R7YT56_CONA1|nr:uncharacterized protein W97_04305 [Coniosporium apollinis CBS 100218]EON65070.1 hypothetical protein W97_04305 [Coniosporium apollinis CBS 100218]